MDKAALNAFVTYIYHQRHIMDYVHVSAAAIMVYDYAITTHLEIQLIWLSPWNYTKIIYLLSRYITVFNTYSMIAAQVPLNVSLSFCSHSWPATTWLLVIKMVLAEGILAIRTWAIWHRNLNVGIVLAVLMASGFVVQGVFINRFNATLKFAPSPYVGFRGCYLNGASRTLWVNYTALIVVQAVVLALVVASAVKAYRLGSNHELSNVIHRDGILTYVYLLVFSIANLVCYLALPLDLMAIMSPMEDVLYAVLISRIVFNIRSLGQQDTNYTMQLHDMYSETTRVASGIRYAPRPNNTTDWTHREGSGSSEDIELSKAV